MRRLCALALAAALGAASFVSQAVAAPTVIQWYDPILNQNKTVENNSTNALPTVDQNRDRDFPLITQLFSGQSLTCKQTYSMTTAVPVLQYTRAAIMLTWAAASVDTDSVRIAVRVYGTTSPTSGNWHLWTPQATYTTLDSCAGPIIAGSDSLTHGRCLKPVSFWVGRWSNGQELSPWIYGDHTWLIAGATMTAGNRVRIRKIPAYAFRWGSANGVMLNLTDNAGAPCPFPYIRIEVTNCTGASSGIVGASCALTNIEANLWPRVQ